MCGTCVDFISGARRLSEALLRAPQTAAPRDPRHMRHMAAFLFLVCQCGGARRRDLSPNSPGRTLERCERAFRAPLSN